MKLRHSPLVVVVALCLATSVQAQYVEDSIDVGHAWVGSLAYNSREDVVYGASEDGVFFVISCDSNKLIKSLSLGGVFMVAYDSIDNKAYCTFGDSLLVVDGATHSRVKSLPMEVATVPVWDPVSDRVYVSCQTTNKVAVVDCANDSLLTYVSVGACPMKMYINTRRHKLYVLNYDDGTVSIVNMTTNQVIKSLFVGGTPNAGYYFPSVDKFYSAGAYGYCTVIDGTADSVVARVSVPGTEDVLCATGNEAAGIVFAGMFAGNSGYIIAIDAEADTVLYLHDLGHAFAQELLYSTKSGYVCSANYENSVSVLSADGARVVKKMTLGDAPFVLASAPSQRRLYVGNLNTRWVYVLRDTATEAIAEPWSPRPEFCGFSVAPNPFRRNVAVVSDSPAKCAAVTRVYAQDGRLVRQARIPSGQNRWVWDGRDDSGRLFPPGVYVIEAGPGLRAKVVRLK